MAPAPPACVMHWLWRDRKPSLQGAVMYRERLRLRWGILDRGAFAFRKTRPGIDMVIGGNGLVGLIDTTHWPDISNGLCREKKVANCLNERAASLSGTRHDYEQVISRVGLSQDLQKPDWRAELCSFLPYPQEPSTRRSTMRHSINFCLPCRCDNGS